ncbi:hypothetical protein ACJ72_04538 [Emergomyces africanus]|uniref:GIT Spa2 homology (SHD) domain-containing protein n=1 Tax=Emergomyces africanus TaxID=1955775 RepID=A0A1B7NWI4_9EURO|nr:hypothetical protein ACJ72_04538 [Emergomyces africanus]
MTPVSSTDGSEWSGVDRYQSFGGKSEAPQSPALPHGRSALASPPISASGGPPYSPLQMNAPDIGPSGGSSISTNGGGPAGVNGLTPRRPPDMSQNPSPPSSITSKSRTSDGTLSDQRSRRYKMMEDMLLKHYTVLKRFLHGQGREDLTESRPNKARDKLLRLSPDQVMDLSTDVYDELLRRQAASPSRPGGPRPDVPPYLPPRQEFHEKRNQARQVLSSLQQTRFRGLATDVLFELERRFPHFAGMDRSRRLSPAASVRGGYGPGPNNNGYDPRPGSNGSFGYGPNGYPAPPRSQSRGALPPGPGPGGRGMPPNPHQGARFPVRQGSLSQSPGGGPGAPVGQGLGINEETIPENAPFPKTFQSNTIVPNKSTMVEEEEEEEEDVVNRGGAGGAGDDGYDDGEDGASRYDDDNDPDRRSDAFALDKVLQSRRTTATADGGGVGVGVGSEKDKQMLVEAQGQVAKLEKQVEELEKSKNAEVDALKLEASKNSDAWDSERREWESMRKEWDRAKEEWDKMKLDLEMKLSEAHDLNASLQDQLEGERREYESSEQNLQEQIQQALAAAAAATKNPGTDTDGGGWKSRVEDLERENQELREELQHQREVTEQVRKEASNFLQEMRALSERTQEQWEREEQLTQDFQRMEEEVKIWKNRYAKTKAQLRHLRSSSSGLPSGVQDATTVARDSELRHPDGLVKDVHLTKFQMSIDELLRTARISEPAQVLEQMKAVVHAVRYITQDIEHAQGKDDEQTHLRSRAKTRVSATANNLITASKNFANSNGISPVSLLDAAASHLTAAIIELVRTVKIRPTPADEIGDDDDEDNLSSMQSPTYFNVPPSLNRMSVNDSVYSAISSPRSIRSSRLPPPHRKTFSSGQLLSAGGSKSALGVRELDGELEQLRLYLEDQTEGVVQSIQALVSSIRAEPDDMSAIRTHIDAISAVVGNVISATESAMTRQQQQHSTNNTTLALRDRAGPIIRILSDCRDKLAETGVEGSRAMSASEMREVTGKLPPIAFQIARETKELVQRLDQMDMMGTGMGMGMNDGGRGNQDRAGSVQGRTVGNNGEDNDDDDDFR